MRYLLMTVTALLTGATIALAQIPPSAPPEPSPAPAKRDAVPNDDRLDTILKQWSEKMLVLNSFYTRCTRTDKDPILKKEKILQGEAMFLRPSFAKIELTNQANKDDFEKIYFKQSHIFNYLPREKLVMVHEIPQMNPNEENMILSFLRGMKPADAKKRFSLTLQKEKDGYAYIMITPNDKQDKQDFVEAQLVLWIKNPPNSKTNIEMMPARFWYREPNKKEVTYLFTDIVPNKEISKEMFVPTKPQGWDVKYANAPVDPKVPANRPKP